MFKVSSLLYGASMAGIDSVMLSLIKMASTGLVNVPAVLSLAMVVYACQPLIFYKSMGVESLTVMNLLWDMLSDVLVSAIGLFYFKEHLSTRKLFGVMLSFVSIFLLTYE